MKITFKNRVLEVEGKYFPGSMGYRENGVQIDQDEPETFDIESVKENGQEIELNEDEHWEVVAILLKATTEQHWY